MTTRNRDEFYVGYLDEAPRDLGRFLRRVVTFLLVLAAGLAALLATRQGPFDPGTFEFGVERSFEGVLRERPHPTLEVDDGGGGRAALHLVGFGKRGAGPAVAGFDGRSIRLDGTLIYREGETMLEVVSGSVEAVDGIDLGSAGPPVEDLGERTLVGEIVDSKCYLGVMKPGRGKAHRACAALCLRGGIPPVLVVEDDGGERRHILLVDADGAPLPAPALELVALPVEVDGRLERQGDRWTLFVTDIRRMA